MRLLAAAALALAVSAPPTVGAHSGPPFDIDGCHHDRAKGNYHCHRGELRGHVFGSRGELQRRLEQGEEFTAVEKESWFSRVFNRKKKAEAEADAAAAVPPATVAPAAVAPTAPAVLAPAPGSAPTLGAPTTIEDRLRVLKGLYDMKLITEDEYAERRKAILAEL